MGYKKKILVSTGLILTFLLGIIVGASFSSDSTATWVIEENSMSVCGSYIIGRYNSTTSYVRDGKTGEIVYTNTTDGWTFVEARNRAYADGGGLIFVKAGTYTFTFSLAGRNNVWWKGEGASTILKGSGGNCYIYLRGNQTLTDFTFSNNMGVLIYSDSEHGNIHVKNNYFKNSLGVIWQPQRNYELKNIEVSDNVFEGCGVKITLTSESSTQTIQGVKITGNQISSGTIGIELTASDSTALRSRIMKQVLVSNNIIQSCSSDGIKLYGNESGSYYSRWENVSIVNNMIFDCGGYGVNIANSCVYFTFVHENYFDNNTSGAINDAGTNTTKTDNMGA